MPLPNLLNWCVNSNPVTHSSALQISHGYSKSTTDVSLLNKQNKPKKKSALNFVGICINMKSP